MADEVVPTLQVSDLCIEVEGTEVLSGVDLTVMPGETHVLLGPNGGGKTTLLNSIMGLPGYEVKRGGIRFRGEDLTGLEIDERARLGIGMAIQRPPAVRGVRLRQMIEVAGEGDLPDAEIERIEYDLTLDRLIDRDVNMGFSGGEMKRSEMAQLLAQKPALALFDEPESGVDLDNIAVVGEAMNRLLKRGKSASRETAGIIVTHTGHILDYVNADIGHVLLHGQLACKGNPLDLIEEIAKHGYKGCLECAVCQ
jgi:Fe-S cluster assembly ATP-binding protein